jgi:hypothetical protein
MGIGAVSLPGRLWAGFLGWLRQPTTIHGIGALLGVAAGLLAHVLTGDMTRTAAIAALFYAAPHLLINDISVNTGVELLLQAAIRERLAAVRTPAPPSLSA